MTLWDVPNKCLIDGVRPYINTVTNLDSTTPLNALVLLSTDGLRSTYDFFSAWS